MNTRIFTFVLLLAFCFESTAQCVVAPSSIKSRLLESSIVVEGKIIGSSSFWGEKVNLIYTRYEIEIFRVLKGEVTESTIEMVSTGGVIGGNMTVASPSFSGEIGTVGIFMLKKYEGNAIDNSVDELLVGVAEDASLIKYLPSLDAANDVFYGKFSTLDQLYQHVENFTQQNNFVKNLPEVSSSNLRALGITNISPTTVTAGTETLLTITGTDFGLTQGTVFFANANDGGATFIGASAFHIQSWSNTQITVWVPTRAGTGNIIVQDASAQNSPASTQTLTVTYNISNLSGGQRTYLIDDACDSDGGYIFLYSTSTANSGVNFVTESGGAAQSSFERALDSWHTNGFSIFAGTDCGTTTIQIPGDDGTNIVSFDSNHNAGAGWDLDVQSGSTTVGVAYSQFSACPGFTEWEVVGMDVVFRRDGDPNGTGGSVDWEYGPALPAGSETDFESVALHELGHNHQLGHVINNGAVMHYSIMGGTTNRTLGAEDIAGANDVETLSVNYNPTLINCGGDFNCSRDYVIYAAANDCAIPGGLPVELASFDAKLTGVSVRLDWETFSETNNDYFILEHSKDGNNFEFFKKIQGAGTVSTAQNYRVFDHQPYVGLNYYRLTQFDFDGHSEVLGVQSVKVNPAEGSVFIQPNPSRNGIFNLNFSSPQNDKIELQVLDLNGKSLLEKTIDVSEGNNFIRLSTADWNTGVYILKTIQNGEMKSQKFIKMD